MGWEGVRVDVSVILVEEDLWIAEVEASPEVVTDSDVIALSGVTVEDITAFVTGNLAVVRLVVLVD